MLQLIRNEPYAVAGITIAGYLKAYRVRAPLVQLERHVTKEFLAHWDKPTYTQLPVSDTDVDVGYLEETFRVHLRWFAPHTIRNGIYYHTAAPSQPDIWIDKDRQILYFLMTD